MKKLHILLTTIFLLSSCANISEHSRYPSIAEECEISSNNESVQCNILNKGDLTQNEKEHLLGFIYWMGTDVKADYPKAKYWFERAAKQGNPQSINALGVMNYLAQGVPKDNKKAEEYYLLAAKEGSKQAKLNLGDVYREGGFGVDTNYDKALHWYQLGIADEPARAYNGISLVYMTQEEYEQAYKYLVKAADLGYPQAQNNLGYYYDAGIFVEQDKEKAKYWYKKAISQGDVLAKENLKELINKEQ